MRGTLNLGGNITERAYKMLYLVSFPASLHIFALNQNKLCKKILLKRVVMINENNEECLTSKMMKNEIFVKIRLWGASHWSTSHCLHP